MQIQTIKYGFNGTKRIKKETGYIYILLISTLWYEFSSDFVAQSNFGKKIHKKITHLEYSYLKYALKS